MLLLSSIKLHLLIQSSNSSSIIIRQREDKLYFSKGKWIKWFNWPANRYLQRGTLSKCYWLLFIILSALQIYLVIVVGTADIAIKILISKFSCDYMRLFLYFCDHSAFSCIKGIIFFIYLYEKYTYSSL